ARIGAKFLIVDDDETTLPDDALRIMDIGNLVDDEKSPMDVDIHLSLEQPASIILTSGTTSRPKAVLQTLGNHYYNAVGSNRNIPFTAGDRWLLSLPLYHVGGLAILFRALTGGGAVVIADRKADLYETTTKFGVTHLSLVPTQLRRLLDTKMNLKALSRQLKAVLIGGGTVPPKLIHRSHEIGLPIFTSYGLTEMGSQVATTRPGDPVEKLLTSGVPLDYREVKISPDKEILVRGEVRFSGYVTDHGLDRFFDADGWFATGDVGYFDEDGYLAVTGRLDNMFVSGGENIYPEEIEAALCELDSVIEAIVVPVDHDEYGSRPVAFVRCTSGHSPDEKELRSGLEGKLARFKLPDRFFPWPETAVSSGIKAGRRQLQQHAWRLLSRSH
ncbi:MAG: o-succinylbenzoate--CoA ligase, partial [Candidatus Zixiibacteriota bacterium]